MTKYVFLTVVLGGVAWAAGLLGLPKSIGGFEKWTVVAKNLDTGGAHAGQGKLVFANKVAAAAWKKSGKLPIGSLIVKTAGKVSSPTLVATMEKRSTGWYYEEYFPRNGKYVLVYGGPNGQALCKDCHAGGTDELFTRP